MTRSVLFTLMLLTIAAPTMAADRNLPEPAALEASTTPAVPAWVGQPDVPRRPKVLSALYVAFAALQLADGLTTSEAVKRGAQETNPLLRGGNRATVWAVKGATSASTIYFTERLWKNNRVAAIVVMAGINAGYLAIAAHNTRQAR